MTDLTYDRLEEIMDNWRRFQKSGGVKLGLPARSVGLSTGGSSKGSDEMLEPVDFADVLAVEGLLEGFLETGKMAHYCAIQHAYLNAVYRFRDYEKTLTEAKDQLRAGLKRRGIWMG